MTYICANVPGLCDIIRIRMLLITHYALEFLGFYDGLALLLLSTLRGLCASEKSPEYYLLLIR
jgi:hypothetical protein